MRLHNDFISSSTRVSSKYWGRLLVGAADVFVPLILAILIRRTRDRLLTSNCGSINPFRLSPGCFSFELELEPLFLSFNCWKIADIQAHSAAPSAALRACISAIFERNHENVCKPLDILSRFYEYPRCAIFEKVNICSNLWIYIFQRKPL